ncbi:response regulator [Niveibacterium sp.]|uniref:ATP-binding response regulator n=1 Tax=Niveibacterium sp. TaxID=2017444 RepID=UPI0035B179E4
MTGIPTVETRTQTLGVGPVLVVDDYNAMRKVTVNQLRQLGAEAILEASNGEDAWNIIERESPSLVLCDWNMPVLDGYELLLRVRSTSATRTLPFIMITAEGERRRVEQLIDAGVSDLIVKPYTTARLAERVQRVLSWAPRGARRVPPASYDDTEPPQARVSRDAAVSRATLLVVDDTEDNLALMAGLFKDSFQVKAANNGERALLICQSDNPPDIVLLDIMMPGMDGFEVAEAIRSHPSSEHIPIIFVTAHGDEATHRRAMALGAIDFVTKPIDPDTLQLRVKNFLRYIELHRGLQQDYDTMMEAARLREDVEHITRHDIKGPLAGVAGLAQGLLESADLSDEVRAQLRLIEESALNAMDLINLSAEVYKIETGRFKLRASEIFPAKLLQRLVDVLSGTYAAKGLSISMILPDGVTAGQIRAWGDQALLYSALQNLLKNAFEAAPEGGRVVIAFESVSPVKIAIRNDGAVPSEIRESFFDKFVTAGKRNGTGLGTYSARLLIEAQHGRISMTTSDANQATTVLIEMPSAAAHA